jgi:hypothetical protein
MRVQAATLANLGHSAEARELYRRYAAQTGGELATVAQYRAYLETLSGANIPIMVAYREHLLAGLRKAGMPEEREFSALANPPITIAGAAIAMGERSVWSN